MCLETSEMEKQLDLIVNTTETLKLEGEKLQNGLDKVKKNLSDISTECAGLPGPPPFCNNTDSSNLATDANFTTVPDVQKELQNVRDVTGQDFAGSAQEVCDQSF